MKKYVVITDLDATLLDRDDYSWTAAQAALDLLVDLKIPVIFNSSKTLAELEQLKVEMGNMHSCIAENGSVISWVNIEGQEEAIELVGTPLVEINQTLNELRDSYDFTSFSDLTSEQLAEQTGLSLAQADKAKDRKASEPITWSDSDSKLEEFNKLIVNKGLKLIKGGRFFHVMGDADKSEAIERIRQVYNSKYKEEITVIALGDSPNDKEMLEVADVSVVIPSSHGKNLKLDKKNYIVADAKGPAGWNSAIVNIINQEMTNG